MTDWRAVSLGQIATYRKGIAYSAEDYGHRQSGHPFITIKCFVKGGGYEATGIKFYEGASTKRDHLAAGDVLFAATDLTRAGDIVGSPLRVPDFGSARPPVASMDCVRVDPTDEECDKDFLFHLLMLPDVRRQMIALSAGSTVLHLDTKRVADIRLRIPATVSIQRRIAKVLQSLDNAIKATEALIEKHQQIKAGLMHDLFTRGVLPSGELRPPRSQAPSSYEETPLGPLPVGWEVRNLAEVLAPVSNNLRSGPFGSALLKHELSESGVPLLGIDNIHVEKFVPTYSRFVSDRKFNTLARYAVRPGDVVITIMGTVGRCCVVPDDIGTALSSKHLWTMTLDTARVIPTLVCWQLNHSAWARAWFRRGGQGGIMEAIQSSTLKSLRLPLPPIDEQVRIADRYVSVQARIHAETERVIKLRAQKLGLMQDLLTGKVSVKLPDPVPEPAVA